MNAIVRTEITAGGVGAILEGLRGLGPARLAAMGLVSFGMLCMLALLAFRGGDSASGRMALLYGDLDLREAGQMSDLLDKAHIPHQLNSASDQILVPEDSVASARLLLARGGLPSGGSVGYELFDHADALTSTQFEQEINQTRALEGELVRSVRMIDGVRAARIHLVLPKRDPFATDTAPAQASVLLTMRGAARLDPEGVQAILNLVSAAVPGLKPQAVSIVDTRGDVLARAGIPTGDDPASPGNTAAEMQKAIELRLSRHVEEMLEASLGSDAVRAEAAVTLDMSRTDETQETFDPDQQVVRSTQTVSDKSKNTEPQQNTSVANNLPNADAGRPQAGSQNERQEETSNYEIGKTVRTRSETAPRVKRLSIAVLVDGETVPGKDGRPVWQARSPAALADITALVKSAVGFDAARGDTVTVETMRFSKQPELPGGSEPGPGPSLLASADLMRLAQTAMIGLVALGIALFVFRPMIRRLAPLPADAATARAQDDPAARTPGQAMVASGQAGALRLDAAPNAVLARADANEAEPGASALRRLGELVEQFPDESLAILRGWLAETAR